MKMFRPQVWLVIFLFLTLRAVAGAAEVQGTVTNVTEKYATVVSDSELLPSPGDKAAIYFKLAGADDEISVGEGHIYEITGSNIMVEIDNATGVVEKGHLVRVTSERPRTRTVAAQAMTTPMPSTPASTAPPSFTPMDPSPDARKPSPSTTIKDEPKARAFVIPAVLEQCETGQQQICGRWTRQGNAFRAVWRNGATATIAIERFDANSVVLTRRDTKDVGFSARYSGKVTGNKIRAGRVTWNWQGRSWSGTWTASW